MVIFLSGVLPESDIFNTIYCAYNQAYIQTLLQHNEVSNLSSYFGITCITIYCSILKTQSSVHPAVFLSNYFEISFIYKNVPLSSAFIIQLFSLFNCIAVACWCSDYRLNIHCPGICTYI